MSEQQYRVIADRETLRGFLMNDPDVMKNMPDSAIERVLARAWRIERPVPATRSDDPPADFWMNTPDPPLPTREQIAHALRERYPDVDDVAGLLADAVLALFQKEADRG